jgi:magnesium transporter
MDPINHNRDLDEEHEHGSTRGPMDSRTGDLDDLLNEKLERAFHKQTAQVVDHELAKIAMEYDPIDLAYAVTRLPQSARPVVFENLPDLDAKISFMINTGSTTRMAIFRHIGDQEINQMVENMPPDEAVWILDDLPKRRLRAVLEQLPPQKAARIRALQRHGIHSAGRLMTNEFFAFHLDTTIGEVASHIRNNPGIELTRRVFVLNSDGELVGFVPARTLIVNPPEVSLRQVMRPILHQVGPDASRDEVVDLVERYKIPALPVTNDRNMLLGVIAYEDVIEAMEEIADDTIASIGGTVEDVSEREPILLRILWRTPWLLVTLCAGLATATAMSHFKDRHWFAFVPFFVPLITGMSGNVGIQTSTIMVRGISTGELSRGTRKEAVIAELTIGLLIGCLFGLICGCIVYLLNSFGIHQVGNDPVAVGTIVSCGILGACVTATVLGALSPLAFAKMRIDPAVASGPIVTAFNDVLSTLMYFLIAWSVSSLFFSN